VLATESIQAQSIARLNGAPDTLVAEVPQAAPRESVVAEALPPPDAPAAASAPAQQPALPQAPVARPPAPLQEPELPNLVLLYPVKQTRIYVQAGAFSQGDNATRMQAKLSALGPVSVTGAQVNGLSVYRVRLGPIASVDEADQVLAKAVNAGATDAKIVVD
jgi:rare lipoprotein A